MVRRLLLRVLAGLAGLAVFVVAVAAAYVWHSPYSEFRLEPNLYDQDWDLVETHLLTPQRSVRVADPGLQTDWGIAEVILTVDEQGLPRRIRVYEVVGEARREVRAQAREWKFRPFLDASGKPVRKRVLLQVGVLPNELRPRRKVAFPAGPLEKTKVTLRRTGCFGTCPSYQVSITGTGEVRYEGIAYVAHEGVRTGAIPQATAAALIERFKAADFFSLDDDYAAEVFDIPLYCLSIEVDGRRKTVSDYGGLGIGMPQAVSDLEEAVDSLAGVERWLGAKPPSQRNAGAFGARASGRPGCEQQG